MYAHIILLFLPEVLTTFSYNTLVFYVVVFYYYFCELLMIPVTTL